MFDLKEGEWLANFNEPYNESTDTVKVTKQIANTSRCVIKNHVYNLKYCEEYKPAMDLLRSVDYTIALLRRDNFESALSLAVSLTTQDWVKVRVTDPIVVDPLLFIKCYKQSLLDQIKVIENPWGFKYNKIMYTEDLGKHPNYTITTTGLELDQDIVYRPNKIPMMLNKKTHVKNYNEIVKYAKHYREDLLQYIPNNFILDKSYKMFILNIKL